MMFEQLHINKRDKYYLLFLIIFSTILVGYYINFNNNIGIYCSDVYVYLLNAIYYTGTNIRSTDTIYLSPLICGLTSIFFYFGFVDKIAIYIVTGAFAIFGNIACYLLFKRFFNENLSLTGAIIYSSTSLYLTWLANGTLDIPAISMTLWTGLFLMMAIHDNPKYYQYAAVFLILGIFTRYTLLLTMPAFALYYIYEKGFKIDSKDLKYILRGIGIAMLIAIIVLSAIMIMSQGHFGAGNQISSGISGAQGSSHDPAYNTNKSYYVDNFINFISNSHTKIDGNPILENPTPLSWAVMLLLIIGVILWIFEHKRNLEKKDAIPCILFLLAAISFTHVSSVITTLIVLVGLYFMGKDSPNKAEYFMLAWIFSNIIFYSYYSIKVNRYILPIFPPVIYFVLLATNTINERFKINENIIPLLLICLFILQAFTFTFTFEVPDKYKAIEDASNYIIENNPDYEKIPIGVYNVRSFNWWLGEHLLPIASNDEETIDASNATYYISDRTLTHVKNYTQIKDINNIYIYKKGA